MAVLTVMFMLIAVAVCEATIDSYTYKGEVSQFGELLRPPPPPPLPIYPVPFHRGSGRYQNPETYKYQVPPPPQAPLPPITAASEFKFPAPFYRQYNFDFVPHPQPFTTTPSPTIFQKVSQWLFPSQQIADDINSGTSINSYSIPPSKKDCNPCNFSPWIPVIRYDLTKNNRENIKPVYGPPQPTASSNVFNSIQHVPQRFENADQLRFSSEGTHVTYGLPKQTFATNDNFFSLSSTYGPPSPTHTITVTPGTPVSNAFSSIKPVVTSSYDVSSNSYNPSSSNQFTNTQGIPTSSLTSSSSIFLTQSSTHAPSLSHYKSQIFQSHSPSYNNLDFSSTFPPAQDLQLPKVEQPNQFKNSYGEPIVNTYALNIPYSFTSAGAESHKINTEVLPDSKHVSSEPNISVAIANPAPFSLSKAKNIHTLQPVALPNLSVSPLPPIFNARPFRPFISKYSIHNVNKELNNVDHSNNVNIAKSIPIAEFVHSIEYPATVIQSPVIDIEASKTANRTKSYRNIPNIFTIDHLRDISPQATEDHISAANSHLDASFESTGIDYANDIYDTAVPSELKELGVPSNHRPVFADLRGLKDEDIDKYRSENNLQHIDSPLLYLKPSAPHKNYANFFTPSTAKNTHEYEIYDEIPSTESPQESTQTSAWDESRTYYAQDVLPVKKQENINRAKVIQIIVPYTIDRETNKSYGIKDWPYSLEKNVQGRKVQSPTESTYNLSTESYENSMTTTEQSTSAVSEYYNSEHATTQPSDIYDVKEPPFDIIQLQHTIDAWTQQEYSKDKINEKIRSNEKYAKQIPDEFFTTLTPVTNTPIDPYTYNSEIYDHEGSSSVQYVVRQNITSRNIMPKPFMQYNSIERKKVYVVTSKPWREKLNLSNEYESDLEPVSVLLPDDKPKDHLPFTSPRFSNRPSTEDQSNIFSKGWHQTINNLESRMFTDGSSLEDSKQDENTDEKETTSDQSRR
ncbi:unnamed protein product [Leptosia nina]|uniref:Uncharacterized protein n=1 Tax=Leptosia nina TaxID=320188 RepID=A0AAV1JU70_9NEOP